MKKCWTPLVVHACSPGPMNEIGRELNENRRAPYGQKESSGLSDSNARKSAEKSQFASFRKNFIRNQRLSHALLSVASQLL